MTLIVTKKVFDEFKTNFLLIDSEGKKYPVDTDTSKFFPEQKLYTIMQYRTEHYFSSYNHIEYWKPYLNNHMLYKMYVIKHYVNLFLYEQPIWIIPALLFSTQKLEYPHEQSYYIDLNFSKIITTEDI